MSSCDGRDKVFKTTEQDLLETKKLDSFTEIINYIPEGYAEKMTDSIFSNGYTITVKMYTIMDSYITVASDINGVKQQVNYRDFSLGVKVKNKGEILLEETFNKKHRDITDMFELDLSKCVLRDFWIAGNNKQLSSDIPAIYIEYYSPLTKESAIMEIVPLEDKYLKTIL